MTTKRDIEALAKEFISGSERAFNELFLELQRPIYYLAMRFLHNHNDADEIVQRTFMQVYRSISRFRGESTFKTWVYRIAINLCKDQLKSKEHRVKKVALEPPLLKKMTSKATHPLEGIIKQDRLRNLLRIVEKLSHQQKTTVMLRVFEDMAFKEIATVLECKESTAKVHFHQAIVKLRSLVKENNYDMQSI
jgi:RNA polymerase sigma factor (sigma-70 family)